jgi:Nucleotidyltransferase of unknown function (DUF6036)
MDFQANHIAWQSVAGKRLDDFAHSLPPKPKLDITVFGSAAIQLLVDQHFLSVDIDLFGSEETYDFLLDFVDVQGWTKEKNDFYVQVCDPYAFKSTEDWRSRAVEVERHGHLFRFVHPWDVLVSKLQRLEEKDLEAFKLVIAKTGHPTEEEFIKHLQKAVDLYRPKFDEETARGDMTLNTRELWKILWNKEIDVRAEIIRPALLRAQHDYEPPNPNLKTRLANLKLPEKK